MLNGSELAGACFSPSGRTLFFNIFGRARFDEDPVEGMTCAVTGPWHRGRCDSLETSVHGRDGVRAARLRSRPVTPTLPATPSSLSDE